MVAYSFKRRFIVPISLGLGVAYALDYVEDVNAGPKRQTIRAIGKRRHARPGDPLQLYHGMRTKQCFLIGQARCTSVHAVTIDVGKHTMPTSIDGAHLGGGNLRFFAQADGFASAEDMLKFWQYEHGLGKFEGLLIKWEPIDG